MKHEFFPGQVALVLEEASLVETGLNMRLQGDLIRREDMITICPRIMYDPQGGVKWRGRGVFGFSQAVSPSAVPSQGLVRPVISSSMQPHLDNLWIVSPPGLLFQVFNSRSRCVRN